MKERELKDKFNTYILQKGYRIVKEFVNNPPDIIIEKDGNYTAVELKGSGRPSIFGVSVGQLLFAKSKYNINDLWLVLPRVPQFSSKEWVILLLKLGIRIFYYSNGGFTEFSVESWKRRF